ncbi:jg11118, partial [Pararge aegeria aegeria]
AAFSCATGAVVCAWSCTRDLVKSSHFMSEAYAWFGAAYFFYDIWSMYMVHVHMTTNLEYFKTKLRRASKPDAALSAGDGAAAKRPSFLAYCRHEPVILMHHVFIGGFGFLVIIATYSHASSKEGLIGRASGPMAQNLTFVLCQFTNG